MFLNRLVMPLVIGMVIISNFRCLTQKFDTSVDHCTFWDHHLPKIILKLVFTLLD